ncbi:unnamed protein product [Lactuca virosa]|uniref:Uncharacterized protein n=1 Tax=Lactuca virosa TaxID=75947 RepID=A0AAU9M1X9_9ASTR|nr:unnamed protein product [Lactuca virosa]
MSPTRKDASYQDKNKEENVEKESTLKRFTKSTARRIFQKESPKPNEKRVTEEKESSKNVPEQKSSQRRRKRKAVSLTRKKKLDQNQDSECSPGSLLSVIQGFSDVQKDCVRKMGFGDILKMKMIDVPGALSCFVLQKFNSKTKKIVMEGGVIDVTRESVNQILGFPLGKTKFSSLPFRIADDNSYEKWTERFDNKSIIRLKEIKMKIVSSNKSDMNFKLNFLALLINSLIETSSSGKQTSTQFDT